MQNIEIEKLKNHPKNKEFFDDIHGEQWEDFKKSIVRRGVVEGIVVTQDLMIVSGHQRVRACKELGILEVPCRITHYPDVDKKTGNSKEDMILEDLICTNIMQRGVGNVNPMKMAKCIMELERIYGIRHGGDRKSCGNKKGEFRGNQYIKKANIDNTDKIIRTQSDLADRIGVCQRQLQDYKRLNNLIPELQLLIENGSMKATVGYKIWAKMPQDEQEKFFNEIGRDKIEKLTQKSTQELMKNKKNSRNISNVTTKHLISRSKGKCEICDWGGVGLEGVLIPHHIHKFCDTQDNGVDNLILICPNCHGIIHTIERCSDEILKIKILKSINNKNIEEKIKYYIDKINKAS